MVFLLTSPQKTNFPGNLQDSPWRGTGYLPISRIVDCGIRESERMFVEGVEPSNRSCSVAARYITKSLYKREIHIPIAVAAQDMAARISAPVDGAARGRHKAACVEPFGWAWDSR